MERGTTLFLKVTLVLIGIPIIALCIFVVPGIANYAVELYPNMTYFKYLLLTGLYVPVIPFYFALYQAFKLLSYIDKSKAFSDLSVKALKTIKGCAIAISILFVADMPLFYLIGEKDDAPGVIVIGLFIIFVSIVVAVFAAVLQKLLEHAIDIKSENDLTV